MSGNNLPYLAFLISIYLSIYPIHQHLETERGGRTVTGQPQRVRPAAAVGCRRRLIVEAFVDFVIVVGG